MHFQSSDLFLSLSASFCATLEGLFAPIADCFIPFIEAVGVVNFIALLITITFLIVAAALRMHAPIATVRTVREPKRWIQSVEAGKFVEVVRFSMLGHLLEQARVTKQVADKARLALWLPPLLSKRYVNKKGVVHVDVLNWEYATEALLSKNPLKARRAREAFIGKELWRVWNSLEGVTAADRKAVYRLAIEKAKTKRSVARYYR